MMKSEKERLERITTTWNDLQKQIVENGITRENLLSNQFFQWAVTTPLYNIGEQVYNLPSEFKLSYPNIKWSLVSGLRHRLVHDYKGINWSIIVEVIFEDMELFVKQVKAVLIDIE